MSPKETTCFDLFRECVKAIHDGELIVQESQKDKEFHFQNWCQARLSNINLHFEGTGRNIYPDFCLVEKPEGYEIKGLAFPGREKDYDLTVMFRLAYIRSTYFLCLWKVS